MSELAVHGSLPAVPTVETFGALLGRYMWIHEVRFGWGFGNSLAILGHLKPDPAAANPSALRRSFLDSLDAVIAIMEAAGVKWERHPEVAIRGEAIHRLDGGWEFAGIECLCEMAVFG